MIPVEWIDKTGRTRKAYELGAVDAAAVLGLSAKSVRAMCQTGEIAALPRASVHDPWRIPAPVIHAWVAARTAAAMEAAQARRDAA